MTLVVVRGATLAGIAASARLAKAGHKVILDPAGTPFGGHWGARDGVPDELPQTFALRAAWMDLFKKSGRAFDAELTRNRLELTPAPPTRHLFADGRRLDLPAERGAQFHAISAAFGRDAATRWSALLDDADAVWFALRMAGLERPASYDAATRKALWAGRTLADLADRLREPHLAAIVASLGPLAGARDASAPALLISRAVIERQFGRWQLVDADRRPQPAGTMLDLLRERLVTRKVEVASTPSSLSRRDGDGASRRAGDAASRRDGDGASRRDGDGASRRDGDGATRRDGDGATRREAGAADADLSLRDVDAELDARPCTPDGWLTTRRATAAFAPTVRHHIIDTPDDVDPHGITRIVDHTADAAAPVVRWLRPLADGSTAVVEHDHRAARPDLGWGLAPSSWRAVTARPALRDPRAPRRWRASASSPGGNDPWAELLSAALAVYDLHETLTGADIRPTNRSAGRPARHPQRPAPPTAG